MAETGHDATHLIGREGPLRRLAKYLDAPGGSGVVLVTGPGGIGKSTVLHALADMAAARGIRVGWGVAGEWEGASPLWPWYDALSSIDPGQSVVASGIEAERAMRDKLEVFRSVALWLQEAANERPVLLVLDDMHAADPTALELLAYLSRRPASRGAWIVASSRPGSEATDALRGQRIVLHGFTLDDVVELAQELGMSLDSATAAAMVHRTGGNPMFVQRLLEHGALASEGSASLPSDVVALLREQIDAMGADMQPWLEALAVLGTTDRAVLRQMVASGVDPDLGGAPTGAVIAIDGSEVSFRHALLRELLYGDLEPGRRLELHARAASVLKETGAGPIVLAHHLGRAASETRGPDAADAAWNAGRIERSIGALPEAAGHFALAASILADIGDDATLARVLVDEADVLGRAGRISEAEQRLAAIVDLSFDPDPDIRRQVVRGYSRLRWWEEPNPSVLDADALARLATAWLGESADPHDEAVLDTARVAAAEIRGLQPTDLASADRAVAAAKVYGDPLVLAEAHLARRRALMVFPDRFSERRIDSEAALRAADRVADIELTTRAQRLALCDALAAGDRERAMALLAGEPTSAAGREHLALAQSCVAALEGRYVDAEQILDDVAKELAYLGVDTPSLDFVRIAFRWDTGLLAETLAEFEPLLPAIADPALRGAVALAKAMSGQREVASTLIEESFVSLSDETPSLLWTVAMAMVAEAAAAVDHPLVPEIHAALEPFSGKCVGAAAAAAPWVGAVDRLLGLLCLRMGRNAEAVGRLERSLVTHDRMHAEPWSARSHAALAVAHARLDDRARAEQHQAVADEIRTRLKMGADVLLVGDYEVSRVDSDGVDTNADDDGAGVFVRQGDVWRVGRGDRAGLVRHSSGMHYLDALITRPDVDWHVLDLYATAGGRAVVLEGHSGAKLDARARAAYQRRYQELTTTLEDAVQNADTGVAERARDEIEFLEQELIAAFGLGGRARNMGDPTEKARINVQRAITRAIDRVAEQEPEVAEHLRHSIVTGRFCRYSPGAAAAFRLG
ncbi:MAG: AAA family ATPase [Acidimicrobiales bacterium]